VRIGPLQNNTLSLKVTLTQDNATCREQEAGFRPQARCTFGLVNSPWTRNNLKRKKQYTMPDFWYSRPYDLENEKSISLSRSHRVRFGRKHLEL
jgi:hypothetical protein